MTFPAAIPNPWKPSYIDKVYNSDYVLTLDELPDVYHYQSANTTPDDTPTQPQPEYAATMTANPVISRNVPAYSGAANASYGNDNAYYTAWNADAPDYLAYDLSSVPASQRKQVIAVWYNNSTYDDIGIYVNRSAEPIDYTIEVNAAPGGSYPESGWISVAKVTNNGYSSQQHIVDMEGYNWIRMSVTKADGNKVSLNFDVHDASHGVSDSWIFFGDSITAGSMGNAWGTSFAEFVNRLDARYYPAQQNGGIGGIASADGKANMGYSILRMLFCSRSGCLRCRIRI